MARTFLTLKVTLLLNRGAALRHDATRLRSLALTTAIFGYVLYKWGPDFYDNMSTTGEFPDPEPLVAVQSFSLVFMWIAMPLTFAGKRDLDIRRFQLLPMRPVTMTLGVATTWLVSPWIWVTAAIGAVLARSFPDATARLPLLALGVVTLVLMCAVAGQLVVAGADLLARNRRARDFLLLLSLGVVAVPTLLFLEVDRQAQDPANPAFGADVISWLPPAWPGRAIASAGQGETSEALMAVAASLAVIALGWWGWTGIVSRALLAEDASTQRRRRSHGDPFAGFARRLPQSRRGAVAALELRLLWREPARLPAAVLTTVLFGGVFVLLASLAYGADDQAMAVLGVGVITITVMGRRMNEIGIHSSALWTNVVAPGRAADDLIGRDLANAAVDVPLLLIAGIAVAAVSDGWTFLAAGLVIGVSLLAASYGAVHVISVRMAQGKPRSMDAEAPTQQGQDPILALAGMLAYLLVSAPVFAAAALVAARGAVWLVIVLPATVAYGGALWLLTLRSMGDWLDRHQADLLQRLGG